MDLDEILDKTKCAKAQRKIRYEDGVPVLSPVKCLKDKEKCEVCMLWKDSKEEVEQIIEKRQVDDKIINILSAAVIKKIFSQFVIP